MQMPVQVTFRNMDQTESVEDKIRERVAKLETYFGRINSCRVVVEAPQRRHRKGRLYRVHIEVGIPGKDVVVSRHPQNNHAHEDVYVAVRDAFDAAQRQLEDHARRASGRVKTHEAPLYGSVIQLLPDEGYGFAAADDGREIYFHKNSVAQDGFDTLELGAKVRLVVAEREGEQGPQASAVMPLGKHSPPG